MKLTDYRYLSASDAVWRLKGYKTHGHFPPVERLNVHLPDQQMVNFDPEEIDMEQLELVRNRSKLLQYFEYNQ